MDGTSHKVTYRSFGLLTVLLLIIVGVGLIIFRLSQPNQSKAIVQPIAKTPPAQPATLAVTEWGIEVPLKPVIKNAVYIVDQADSNQITLSLKQYQATDCAANKTGLGLYRRFMAGDIDGRTAHTYISEYPGAKQIDSYYYIYQPVSAACTLPSNQLSNITTELAQAITNGVSSPLH